MVDISQLTTPNAIDGHKALKAAKRGNRSHMANRLRDPAVILLDVEREWLAKEITGVNKPPAHRRQKSPEQCHLEAYDAWSQYYKCLRDLRKRYSSSKDARIISLAKHDAAKILNIDFKTINKSMEYFNNSILEPYLWGAEVRLMTDEEYALHRSGFE